MRRAYWKLIAVFILAMALFVPACGGGGGGGGGGTGFLTGTWGGVLHDPTYGDWSMVMGLTHDDLNIRGTITLTLGNSYSGNFTGTVSDPYGNGTTSFAWVINTNNATYQFVGTYTAYRIKGTWTNLAYGVSGTFVVDRVS